MTLTELRRDGRERQGNSGADSARAACTNLKTLSTKAFLMMALVGNFETQAFQVVPTSNTHSMEKLVLGTVNLPNLPCGNPNQFLDDAYERGFRRFDLARTYGLGKSEKIFGKWMENALKFGVKREDITVLTKGGMGNDKYGDPSKYTQDRFPNRRKECLATFMPVY